MSETTKTAQYEDFEDFFSKSLKEADPKLYESLSQEFDRQQEHIELIASENIVSRSVLDAQGSIMTNKYAEGYSGRRYYGGCEYVDLAEDFAISRACELFDSKYANVQPHSGSQANQAVFQALLKPGDTILGMSLDAGGHLTHGAKPNQSGKLFNAIQYGVKKDDSLIDFNEVESLANQHKPKLIIAGGSAYPRVIDFAKRLLASELPNCEPKILMNFQEFEAERLLTEDDVPWRTLSDARRSLEGLESKEKKVKLNPEILSATKNYYNLVEEEIRK